MAIPSFKFIKFFFNTPTLDTLFSYKNSQLLTIIDMPQAGYPTFLKARKNLACITCLSVI